MLAPVIIFVYKRLEHTKETIESLSKNYLSRETEVYIYSDAAKDEKGIEQVGMVREYVNSLLKRNLFKSVKIIEAKMNKGLASSIIGGVTKIINHYNRAIVVEDDIITAPDFLQYMNDALDFYESNEKIWSISGYTFKIKIPADYKHDVYLSYRGCSWGWATWKNRWEKVDWGMSDYNHFRTNKNLQKKINRGGIDIANMLDFQMQGKIDSWAVRWVYTQSKLDMLTVYPIISRVRNIGLDGTGTHSGTNSKFDVTLNNCNHRCKFEAVELDNRIIKSFRIQFGTNLDYIVIKIKAYIKRQLGV